MNIHGIDHVVIRVRELERMVEFYCDVIGCSIERRLEESGLVQLRAGRSLIDLASVSGSVGRLGGDPPSREGHNMAHLCLRIVPFDPVAISTYLKGYGVESNDLEPRYGAAGTEPSMFIKDPEGNTIELKGPPD